MFAAATGNIALKFGHENCLIGCARKAMRYLWPVFAFVLVANTHQTSPCIFFWELIDSYSLPLVTPTSINLALFVQLLSRKAFVGAGNCFQRYIFIYKKEYIDYCSFLLHSFFLTPQGFIIINTITFFIFTHPINLHPPYLSKILTSSC